MGEVNLMTKEQMLKRKKSWEDNAILSFVIGAICFAVKMVIEIFLVFKNFQYIWNQVKTEVVVSKGVFELLQLDMYATVVFILCAIIFLVSKRVLKKYRVKKKVASK